VGFYDTGDEAYDVYVSDSYAYVADRYDGLYVLQFNPPVDVSEPNDDFAHATAIAYGDSVGGVIDPAGDQDYFSFVGSVHDTISADIDAQVNGSALDSYLYLFDADGNELKHNDDWDGRDSRIVNYVLPSSGTFYLKVRDYGNGGAPNYSYTLILTNVPTPVGAISGIITDMAGTPLEDAYVFTLSLLSTTGADGRYVFANLPQGEYQVRASASGYVQEYYDGVLHPSGASMVPVVPPDTTFGIDFALARGGAISGTVRNAQGDPISGAWVEVLNIALGVGKSGRSRSDGSYIFTGLAPGEYRVEARASGYIREYYDDELDYSAADLVTITAPDTTFSIDFVLSAEGAVSGCEVRLPTVSARPGQILLLPVVVDVCAEEIVSSAQMTITYDSDVLRILEATTLNTLAEDWVTEYDIHRGQATSKDTIRIAMATVKDTLSESSTLVFLRAIVSELASPGDMSELAFERFQFNEGDPSVETVDGTLTVVSLLGDASGNGEVGAYDASLVLQHVVELITLTGPDSAVADVSGNGTLSALDASLILRYVVGMISRFPAEGGIAKHVGSERSIALGPLETTDGDLLRIPISIDDMAGVLAGDLELRFDPSRLAFVEVRASDRTEAYHFASHAEQDRIRLAFAGVEAPSGVGRIAEVILRPVESDADLPGGQTDPVSRLTIHRVSLNEGVMPVRIERVEVTIPNAYRLSQNYPNPFNPQTTITYDVAEPGTVRLSVYALTGQLVRTLMDGERSIGSYSAVWDGRDDAGRDVASGVYLCRMEAADYRAVRKMLLVR